MLKNKILSLLLCFFVIFAFSLPLSAEGQNAESVAERGEYNKTLGENAANEQSTAGDVAAAEKDSSGLVNVLDVFGENLPVFTVQGDSALHETFYSVPDEILSASTEDLLSYFLNSPYMRDKMTLCSSAPGVPLPRDFSEHPAFAELLTRDDFLPTLRSYELSLVNGTDSYEYRAFQKLIEQPAIKQM